MKPFQMSKMWFIYVKCKLKITTRNLSLGHRCPHFSTFVTKFSDKQTDMPTRRHLLGISFIILPLFPGEGRGGLQFKLSFIKTKKGKMFIYVMSSITDQKNNPL